MSALDPSTPSAGPAGTRPVEPPTLSAPLSETLHRVANSLAILSATMRLEQRRVADPAARAALAGAVARIEATAQVHHLIYGLPPEARIDLTAFLGHLAPVLGTSLGMGCGVCGVPVEVSARTAEGLAVAMTELAVNAYKHAYGGGPGDGVEVRVSLARGGWVRLAVRDWGRGLAEAGTPFHRAGTGGDGVRPGGPADGAVNGARGAGPEGGAPGGLRGGLGLRLVAAAVETLGGRMTAATAGGARVVIEVPQG